MSQWPLENGNMLFFPLYFKCMWGEDSSKVTITPSQPICPPCVKLQGSVPSETAFSPGTVGGETRTGNGNLWEKQPCNSALHPAVLPHGLPLCNEQRLLVLYKAHIFCKVVWHRDGFCCPFPPSAAFPSKINPRKNTWHYLQVKVLLRECTFSPPGPQLLLF